MQLRSCNIVTSVQVKCNLQLGLKRVYIYQLTLIEEQERVSAKPSLIKAVELCLRKNTYLLVLCTNI